MRVLKNDHYLRRGGNEETEKKRKPATAIDGQGMLADPFSLGSADDEDGYAKGVREEQDKERWSRLKRVKSLFGAKDSKKLQRAATVSKEG